MGGDRGMCDGLRSGCIFECPSRYSLDKEGKKDNKSTIAEYEHAACRTVTREGQAVAEPQPAPHEIILLHVLGV